MFEEKCLKFPTLLLFRRFRTQSDSSGSMISGGSEKSWIYQKIAIKVYSLFLFFGIFTLLKGLNISEVKHAKNLRLLPFLIQLEYLR